MFNENAEPRNNFSYSNNDSQFDDSNKFQMKVTHNETKKSKQSIIDQLDSYDFRDRFEVCKDMVENGEKSTGEHKRESEKEDEAKYNNYDHENSY